LSSVNTGKASEEATGHVRELLRSHGLRYSRPREAILELFHTSGVGHISAEGLHKTLRDAGEDVSLSTVYLNLSVLREAGLVNEFPGANGEAIFDRNTQPHYHLICSDTGEIVDVPELEVDGVPLGQYVRERLEKSTGWKLEEPEITLRGRRFVGSGPRTGANRRS